MKEGYPVRVCDYCQLQLNTFHAFVRKAKITSSQFESMLQDLKNSDVDTEADEEQVTSNEFLSANDMEFEISEDTEHHEKITEEPVEVEFYQSKKVELIRDADFVIPVNGDEGLKTYISIELAWSYLYKMN